MNTTDSNSDYIEIPLTKGQVAWISPDDADLADLKWCVSGNRGSGYAARNQFVPSAGYRKMVSLHRIILERTVSRSLVKGEQVDHINGNSLDNRRENLRIATVGQNLRNTKKRTTNTSGYKGVCWIKKLGVWRAKIKYNHHTYNLGYFKTPEEAYAAYCAKGRELHGEFFNPG